MNKAEQRALALSARRALSAQQRRDYSRAICENLLALPELETLAPGDVVLSYMAMGDEADLTLLHERLRERGLRLAFPLCLHGGVMEAREPGGWLVGPYGIREPDPLDSRRIDPGEIALVLAPCVAFDEGLDRLGHGAGYYDRYLPGLSCPVIAAAFEVQKLDAVCTDAHDRPMDLAVTETDVYRKKS